VILGTAVETQLNSEIKVEQKFNDIILPIIQQKPEFWSVEFLHN